MFRRPIVGLAFWIAILIATASPAQASITAFWQQVTITPEAITNDPALANMQSGDLMVTTSGNWAEAGLRATLPTGTLTQRADTDASQLGAIQPFGEECTVVINPTNPRNIVAFSNTGLPDDRAWYSTDGGLTYTERLIPLPPGATGGRGDPSAAFDRQGHLYYAHLTDPLPLDVSIAKSTDGGQTWALASLVSTGGEEILDKPWITVGPHPDFPADPTKDVVYVTFIRSADESGQGDAQVHVARSRWTAGSPSMPA